MKTHIILLALAFLVAGCEDDNSAVDTGIAISFDNARSSLAEEGESTLIVLSLSEAAPEEVTATMTLSGNATLDTDYEISQDLNSDVISIIIPQGRTSATLTLTPIDDTALEGDESLTLVLKDNVDDNLVIGTNPEHTVTLIDNDDDVEISFENDKSSLDEGDENQTITLNLSEAAPQDLTVLVALSGTAVLDKDYTIARTSLSVATLTVPQGETSVDLSITPIDYDKSEGLEGNETIILTLVDNYGDNLTLGTNYEHTVTLTDNDIGISFESAESSLNEDDAPKTISLNLTKAIPEDAAFFIGVYGTAVRGDDYTIEPYLTFTLPKGQDNINLTITPINDNLNLPGNRTIVIYFMSTAVNNLVLGTNPKHTVTLIKQ